MSRGKIKIEVYISLNCKTEQELRENLKRALEIEGIEAEVTFARIDEGEAERLGLRGSPTIKINGEEFQPIAQRGFT